MFAILALTFAVDTVVLENDYVRVTENGVRCGAAKTTGCGDRVIVAKGDVTLTQGKSVRHLKRGDVVVFNTNESYAAPTGEYWEVAWKPFHPPVQSPKELIRPAKNEVLFENSHFFVFEEKLAVGDTRARHSHSQRVVIQLNKTKLHYWVDGEPESDRDITPDRPNFNPPAIHTVKCVGDLPLRGIVLELKPERQGKGKGEKGN